MGARYAAAEDLSEVIGNELHESQFLPFIGYTIEFAGSQMVMDVQLGNPAPRAPIWQFPPNGTTAQSFAFEDAGNGFVYIRSNISNLYVTLPRGRLMGLWPSRRRQSRLLPLRPHRLERAAQGPWCAAR